ncbi:MAG: inositol monophosphatase family protein [Prochlorococcus sp.]
MNTTKTASQSGLQKEDLNRFALVARRASELGGQILMEHYGRISSIESKGRVGDLVTNADLAAEQAVLAFLHQETPELAVLAEESGVRGKQNPFCWCLDPLDGTTNFAHGYPFFATSIGLTWNDQPILGAVDVPFLKETYWGCPGKGAFCNETPISVTSCSELKESLLVTGFAYDRQTRLDNNYGEFCWLTHRTRGVRRGGAAAVDLAFIAAGRVDGYWERGLSPWDLAAGVALVDLAGGVVSDYQGGDFEIRSGRVLACSKDLQAQLIAALDRVHPLEGSSYGAPELGSVGS